MKIIEYKLSTQLKLTLDIDDKVSREAAKLLPSPLNTQPIYHLSSKTSLLYITNSSTILTLSRDWMIDLEYINYIFYNVKEFINYRFYRAAIIIANEFIV